MALKYQQGSLFDAPADTWLVHACNTQGSWGAGIAKQFKALFPEAFESYKDSCRFGLASTGESLLIRDGDVGCKGTGRRIVCLLTSRGYGDQRDSASTIKVNTTLAINHLVQEYLRPGQKFASNKFNSGLFHIPWEQTEEILKVFVDRYNLDWTVYDRS